MKEPVHISGIGVVSSIGIGREAFWQGLESGRSGQSKIDVFDTSAFSCSQGAQVRDFDPAQFLGKRGLRFLDRASRFSLAATELAVRDAGLCLDEMSEMRRGVVLGTAYGGVSSEFEFTRERVEDGPKWVSPLKFPNTPINALSYQIPIRYRMKRLNVTLCAGMTSGLEAARYAAVALCDQMPEVTLSCGGVEELSLIAYATSHAMGELSGLRGEEVGRPFDLRGNGYILGEGCALTVLETASTLNERGGTSLARILGFGSSFAPARGPQEARVRGVRIAVHSALQDAGLEPADIDYISASANGQPEMDRLEVKALQEVFGPDLGGTPISSVKSMVGETFGAGGALAICAAVQALVRGILPPTRELEEVPEEFLGIDFIPEHSREAEARYVLVNSIDHFGGTVSVVLGRGEAK